MPAAAITPEITQAAAPLIRSRAERNAIIATKGRAKFAPHRNFEPRRAIMRLSLRISASGAIPGYGRPTHKSRRPIGRPK